MHMMVPARERLSATIPAYRSNGLFFGVALADPRATVRLRTGSATIDGSAAATPGARKARTTLGQDVQVSFDEHSFKLAILAVEGYGRLGQRGFELVHQ